MAAVLKCFGGILRLEMGCVHRPFPTCALLCTLLLCIVGAGSEENLSLQNIQYWAEEFGRTIYGVSAQATSLVDIKSDYLCSEPKINEIDGKAMVRQMKENMQTMLKKKVDAIKHLVEVAEEAYKNHEEDKNIELSYPKAKMLNTSEFLLDEDEHFNYIPVNLTNSTVHVPTNVYDESSSVLNGVSWSAALDEHFSNNYRNDPTLTWQYFGSAHGFFRNFPGFEWPSAPGSVDLFDCRTRGWYIQAATSPKDIVILLDASGSMKGLRMEIAKATVEKILETLSDDDFFNVIKFSEQPEYVDDCFNGTLVQANADNKKRVKEALGNVCTANIARFDTALIQAFELLKTVEESDKGAQCNRAIMLITDGAPETYEEIFEKYNGVEKNIRVFTFLIGREVGDPRQVHWMACSNKGYFSHISTLADVHEHVQDYIHVISRPMVIQRANHTIWTSVYVDAAGLRLMTSVAQPVYDTKSDTEDEGILLGVMGTDVPLKELTKLTPQYKLGVNGYAFAITNNGYILFHPDFRPTQGDLVKPNYNSVDLSEVELAVDDNLDIEDPDSPTPNYDMKLRKAMVDRETDTLTMKVKLHYDNMSRVAVRTQHYFFTPIDNTPFSLGIALPDLYGLNELDGFRKLDDADIGTFRSSPIKVARWNYCKMDTNETRQDPAEMLLKYLDLGKNNSPVYDERCDKDLIESILWDAEATSGALSAWIKENKDGSRNLNSSRRHGIELVFLGTKGGLTRYMKMVENLTEPNFLEENSDTIEELYYKRAVEGGQEVFTFHIPFDTHETFDWNSTMVTASTPIVLQDDVKDLETVAGVVGLQMRYSKFYEYFMNSTQLCNEPGKDHCNLTCASDELDCYLIDNNGFVVLSEESSHLGKFFGEIDSTLMKELVIDKDQTSYSKRVFEKVQIYDFQGVCEIWKKGSSSATSMFVDPIRKLFSSAFWLVNEIALFLIQFNIFSWWQDSYTTVLGQYGGDAYDDSGALTMDDFYELYDLGTYEEFQEWLREWRLMLQDKPPEVIGEWYDSLKERVTPRLVGHRRCVLDYGFLSARAEGPGGGRVYQEGAVCGEAHPTKTVESCARSYSVNRVHRTNLLLLVVDAKCNCAKDEEFTVEPKEVLYNDTMMCHRLQKEIYRNRPEACYAFHEKENSTRCSAVGLGYRWPTLLLVLLSSLLLTPTMTSH